MVLHSLHLSTCVLLPEAFAVAVQNNGAALQVVSN